MDGNTTVSIALIISILGVSMNFFSYRRNSKKDAELEIENRLKVNVKLDQLCGTSNAILGDVKDINKSVQSLTERMAKVEASTKSAHHRLDEHLGIREEVKEEKEK